MKVAIITRHAISNYGSLLQAYALQEIIERLGHSVEIIDYIRTEERKKNITRTLVTQKKKWNSNAYLRIFYLLIQTPEYVLMGNLFDKFRHKYLHLTANQFSSYDELKLNCPVADIYCTGSDQVWGNVANSTIDYSYYLAFVPDNKPKFTYAASFGKSEFNESSISEVKKYLLKYINISVREDSASQLISNIGLSKPEVVLDPTLLLNQNEWYKFIDRDVPGKYILLYQLHSNPNMDEYAKRAAKLKGCDLIRVTPLLHRIIKGGKPVYCPSIERFLAYFKNAECIITDSFHGTAFSINFNRTFIEILPNNNTQTRNIDILKMTGLEDRILQSFDDFSLLDESINYEFVNDVIENMRLKSIKYLEKVFTEIKQ